MTLTYKVDLHMVQEIHHLRSHIVGQRSLRSRVITQNTADRLQNDR